VKWLSLLIRTAYCRFYLADRWLYDLFLQGKLELAVTTEIINEYTEILEQKTNTEVTKNVIQAMIENPSVTFVEPSYRWTMITKDADDDKYVDCAVAANADYLISNHKHFAVLDTIEFPKIKRLKLNQVKKTLFN
jgi:predicted nucleic acid-binding protein